MNKHISFRLSHLFLLILAGSFGLSYGQSSNKRPLTFEDAVMISIEQNLGIKEAKSYSHMKELEVKSARGLYLPRISLDASWIVMSEDIHLDLTPVQEAITPLYSALGNYGTFTGVPNPDATTNTAYPTLPDNVSTQAVRGQLLEGLETIEAAEWDKTIQKNSFGFVSAGVTSPIYLGGKIRLANRAANIHYKESLNEAEIKRSKVISEVVERYFALVLAQEALGVRKEVFETMKLHLHDAQLLKEQGMIANAEYLHAKVFFSSSERELKKTKRQIQIAHEGLMNTLSTDGSQELVPISKLFYTESLPSVRYFIDNAKEHSLLLEKVNHKKELATAKYDLEKGTLLPSVVAMGTYDLLNKDLSPYMPEYMLGVGLKWDLFQGISRFRNIKAARVQQEQVDHIYNKASSDISTAITKYYEELSMYLEQLHDLETAQEFASEYSRVRQKAFSEGMATSTEVSDANLALAKVKIERLQAMYMYDVALSNLLYYSGLTDTFAQYQITGKVDNNRLSSIN